jgi:1-aminocyclopropane-1-carboxylate deaminase/D-cysteine desulfhydrase-like pyridoxal-dependent ACC family enzyme
MLEIISDPLFDNQTILFFHTGGIQGGKYIAEKENVDLYPKSK